MSKKHNSDALEITIRFDGATTTATLWTKTEEPHSAVRKAKAVCSPRDVFKPETGALLAIERLFEKKQQEKKATKRAQFSTQNIIETEEFLRGLGLWDEGRSWT